MRQLKLWLLALALSALAASPAAAATAFYAAPKSTRTTQPCTQETPCRLDYAMLAASASGDQVVLDQGDYYDHGTTPYAGLPPVRPGVTVRAAGESPVIHGHVGVNDTPFLDVQGGGTVRDLELDSDIAASVSVTSGYTLRLEDGALADRLLVRSNAVTGSSMIACDMPGGTLMDSACLGSGPGSSDGVAGHTPSQTRTLVVRNVTAISSSPTGKGIVLATDTGTMTMNVINSILMGPTDVLVAANQPTGSATLRLDYSNFATTSSMGSGTPKLVSGLGNQGGIFNVKPLFVNASGGDYREAKGSPTIDAGISDPANGGAGLGGGPRSQGKGPDMGAYEYVPTPTAVTGGTQNVTQSSATLLGTVTPDTDSAKATFAYGTTTAYTRAITAALVPATAGATAVSAGVSGLAPDTTYHYRLAATSSTGGKSQGQDRTFHTLALPSGSSAKPALVSAVTIGRRWRLGSHLPRFSRRRRIPVGTRIRFTLSRGTGVTLTFKQRTGRRRVAGKLSFTAFAGRNTIRFQGRLSRHKRLRPGRYTLTVTPQGGSASSARPFTIVR
jgi:hypothetical protein